MRPCQLRDDALPITIDPEGAEHWERAMARDWIDRLGIKSFPTSLEWSPRVQERLAFASNNDCFANEGTRVAVPSFQGNSPLYIVHGNGETLVGYLAELTS